jgi:hypothetical protein
VLLGSPVLWDTRSQRLGQSLSGLSLAMARHLQGQTMHATTVLAAQHCIALHQGDACSKQTLAKQHWPQVPLRGLLGGYHSTTTTAVAGRLLPLLCRSCYCNL